MGALQTTEIHSSESSSLLSDAISFYFWLQLRDFLESRRTTVGISDMTDDLLGKIFYHLCERGSLSLRHLHFVSRRFYSVIVNNAHLWATISLDSSFFHHFHHWSEQCNRFVEHCLLRSGLLPLCLYIDCSDINAHDATFFLPLLETFGKSGWRGFQRCTSLIWDARHHGMTTIQMFVDCLPKVLPSLNTSPLPCLRI